MFYPLSLFIGLRYTRARRRNQFISFVSMASLLGMILGVFALVVVMSVMNGFEAELRQRILDLVPHGYIDATGEGMSDWPLLAQQLQQQGDVVAVAPYIDTTAMLRTANQARGAHIVAIDPLQEQHISAIPRRMQLGDINNLQAGQYGIVLGDLLSRYLGLYVGDSINVMVPRVTVTPVGIFPRVKRFTVVGVFKTGSQIDSNTALIHLADGQKLLQYGEQVKGLRLQLQDMFSAAPVLQKLAAELPGDYQLRPWSETQGSLFQAVKMEKTMVALLLLLIVTIAAFNIVSILTMMVAEKRPAVAVLRTMGAPPHLIRRIFVMQGLVIGGSGVLIGIVLAIPVALNIGDLVVWVEELTGWYLFNPQVYYITRVPSLLQLSDVLLVAASGLLLSFIATLYPATKAARIPPAEALRYE